MSKKYILLFLQDIIAVINFAVIKVRSLLNFDKGKFRFRILVYHSISDDADIEENNVSVERFRSQIEILKTYCNKIISLKDGIELLGQKNAEGNYISITFDDGMENVFKNALVFLEQSKIPTTFFITYNDVSENSKDSQFVSWNELAILRDKGYEIGCHSFSHKRLSALDKKEMAMETKCVKDEFMKKGFLVRYFAYPFGFYGDFSKETEDSVRKADYEACFTNVMGCNNQKSNLYELKRTRISWRDNQFRFILKMYGAYDWIDVVKDKLKKK